MLAAEHAPDVALMYLILPGMNGVEATRRLTANSPPAVYARREGVVRRD